MANEGIMDLPQGQQMQGKGPNMDALNKAAPRAGAYKNIGKTMQELDPSMVAQYKAAIAPILQQLQLPAEQVSIMIQMFDYLAENKDQYPQILADLIQKGIIEPGDLPEQFDATLIAAIQLVLHEMQDQTSTTEEQQGIGSLPQGQESMQPPFAMKQGGLVEIAHMLQSQGRNGDTMLAHINPEEAAMLKAMGGSGTINPATGLREYGFFSSIWSGIKGAVSSVVGAVKQVVASPIGRIIATVALTMFLGPAGAAYGGGFFASTAVAAGVASAGLTAVGGGSMADVVKSGLMAYGGASAMSAIAGAGAATPGTGAPVSTGIPSMNPGELAPTVGVDSVGGGAVSPPALDTGIGAIRDVGLANTQPTGLPTSVDAAQTYPLGSQPAPSLNAMPPPADIPAIGSSGEVAANAASIPTPAASAPPTADIDKWLRGTTIPAPAGLQPPTTASSFRLPDVGGSNVASGLASQGAAAIPPASGSGISGMVGSAVDWAKTNPGTAALLGVTAATAMGAGKPSETNQKPLGEQWGTGNATGEQYMKDHPEIFGNWKGWKTPGAANQGTPPTPGPTPMNPVSNNPYMMPGGNLNPNPMPQQGNQPYNMPGLYDPRRFAQQQQPPQPQYNTGGPVNNAHVSGSGMQQSMTNAFSGGGGIGALSPSSFAQGGNTNYPRRTGVIEGPGTETSDSIPAMLSDGEFVFTAKAVKKAGNGSRREGAKRMYQLMHMLEHGGKV